MSLLGERDEISANTLGFAPWLPQTGSGSRYSEDHKLTKSQRGSWNQHGRECIFHKERYLNGSWWLPLWYLGKGGNEFHKGKTLQFPAHISVPTHAQRGAEDFPPVHNVSSIIEQSRTEDCWLQTRAEMGKEATHGVQAAKGRAAGLATQSLGY